ncbi:CHAT domain-containing protein [Candidatus Parcubacteria bacterium]|nr:MAG: CHAT domain-containing protein [Candidatus Parcubacteria bacterium]
MYRLVFKPLEPYLAGVRELTVLPDDALAYLPFEVLVVARGEARHDYDFQRADLLLHHFAISYAYTFGSLLAHPEARKEGRGLLLAVGNPDVGAHGDARDRRTDGQLGSLPSAEREISGVTDIVGRNRSAVFVGEAATEDAVKSRATDFRLLHFATHSLVNDYEPLYSKMILARSREGSEDGFLQTYEIFNLPLRADLVVLSACNTAVGRLKRGEGLMSLARAFFSSGARSLVASLWNVNDEATATLMRLFYRNLKAGMKLNVALQQAKIEFLSTAREGRSDPFYWAPFILIGRPDQVILGDEPGTDRPFYAAHRVDLALGVFLAIAVALGLWWRRRSGAS